MIIKIAAVAMIGAILSLVLRHIRPEFCVGVAIATSVLIVIIIKDDIAALIELMRQWAEEANIETPYIMLLVKIIGTAYLTQFASSICEDAGEKAISVKMEFAGRVAIILMSAPLMFAVVSLITGMLP